MSINIYKYDTITIGVAMVFLAAEPDEYFYKIRLESIQFAVVAQFVVGLIATNSQPAG